MIKCWRKQFGAAKQVTHAGFLTMANLTTDTQLIFTQRRFQLFCTASYTLIIKGEIATVFYCRYFIYGLMMLFWNTSHQEDYEEALAEDVAKVYILLKNYKYSTYFLGKAIKSSKLT
ncbi:hypothetical protein CHH92_00025 [Bacillus sonorensis]|uniref:Uncharacterized protein n=2 Tax=Bacillus sonorensis TaxID=119858 RepID=M5P742_9BACI|nr:hypothetical protein S101395_03901 [Bacillus sonorensis]EME75826.1 hypothetical protein BSONL12_02574 [Bacillus sonorensis L12]PAD61902.1 hypothetical protein CHH92_00025 [Bacillus sonorensis]RHJ13863.1 hypothetical protein DW143_04560 [Bacillus sonorensis]